MRHGRKLGMSEQFLARICKEVADAMGGAYPELKEDSQKIVEVTSAEATKFGETLGAGSNWLVSGWNASARQRAMFFRRT